MEEQMQSNIADILSYLRNEPAWRQEWMKALCMLCLEYLTLDGLPDAKRACDIPEEIKCLMASIDDTKPCESSCDECEFKPDIAKIIQTHI